LPPVGDSEMDICDLLHQLNIGLSQNEVGFLPSSMSDHANSVWRKGPGSNLQAVPNPADSFDALMLENSFQVRNVHSTDVIYRVITIPD
jgi:hypothetical protein